MSHINSVSNNGQLQNLSQIVRKGGQGIRTGNAGGAEEINEAKSGQPQNAAEEAGEGDTKGVNINTRV